MFENSLQYTKNGFIKITLNNYGPYINIEVRDNGIGISADK